MPEWMPEWMPDWWWPVNEWARHALGGNDEPKTADVIAARVALAAVYGFVAATIFRYTLARNRPDVRTMPTTLVLLSALIALVSMVGGALLGGFIGIKLTKNMLLRVDQVTGTSPAPLLDAPAGGAIGGETTSAVVPKFTTTISSRSDDAG